MAEDAVRSTQEASAAAEAPGALSRLLLELAQAPEEDLAASWHGTLKPGEVVGRYQIREEIGRGGFGAVYEAFDPELGRAVALKTLRPGRTRRELTQDWIKKEAEAVARLDHPAIVTVFDVGSCPAGPYLVMELLRGETLQRRLEKGPLLAGEALRVAEEMARALAHAHHRGVLHRDLKPANVFLTDDGRVKLLDFGLAHLLGREGGTSGGTPAYMAPEQARGEAVDERADVYAAGMVLGEMLTGRRPLEPATPAGPAPATSGTELLWPEGSPKLASEQLDWAAAEAEQRRALELDPGLAAAHLELAHADRRAWRFDEMQTHLRQAGAGVERMPDRERLLIRLHFTVFGGATEAGEVVPSDHAKASRLSDELMARFPRDRIVLYAVARNRATMRQHAEAFALYRKVLEMDPGHLGAVAGLLELIRLVGRAEEVVAAARSAAATRPGPVSGALLASALSMDGRHAEAADRAREALRSGLPPPHRGTAFDALVRSGAPEAVEAEMRRTLADATDPSGRARSLRRLAAIVAYQGRRREALALVAEAAAADGNAGSPHLRSDLLCLGRCPCREGEARDAWRAETANPYQAFNLALLGDRDGAALAARGLEQGSDDELAYRAIALAREGRLDEALPLQRALAADTDYFSWTVLLGETLLAAGRPGEALEALRPLELLPWSRVSHEPAAVYPCGLVARARALERLGLPRDAARELDRLLAVWSRADPDLPALAEATAMRARLAARK